MHASSLGAQRVHSLSDFDFTLPPELIAQHPAAERSGSRLLDASLDAPVDRIFRDLPELLRAGDLLVLNDTKVIKARLFGEKPTGGKLELLIERVLTGNQVAAHMRVSKKPEVGTTLKLVAAAGQQDGLCATLLGRWPDADGGMFRFVLSNDAGDDPYTLMERHGHVPLPPYIERPQPWLRQAPQGGARKLGSGPAFPHERPQPWLRQAPQGGARKLESGPAFPHEHADSAQDIARYQTVFARHAGAVAAPTAALHLDDALLAALETRGVRRAFVTLHVGAGTFQPVKTENLSEHHMHSEWYRIPAETQQAIADCQARGGRVVAVGTTTVRSLESWALTGQASGDTDIFITPGFDFQLVDLMITNFHLPKSSLMMLVSAYAGYDRIRALYDHAIARRYRFFSYGDAMLLRRSQSPTTSI